MGSWGTALFSDDVAQDVREEYKRLLEDGLDGAAAAERIIAEWKETIDAPDEGPVFWLAWSASGFAAITSQVAPGCRRTPPRRVA